MRVSDRRSIEGGVFIHFKNCLISSIYDWSEQILTWMIK